MPLSLVLMDPERDDGKPGVLFLTQDWRIIQALFREIVRAMHERGDINDIFRQLGLRPDGE